ncbi:MAG TPA: CoA-binding protein [Roseiarcus sp.]|nr:CoA-binding protein [Roseiarcus sp.]
MSRETYSDADIRRILTGVKSIALVGASANPARPSYIVLKYLIGRDYRMLPINPGLAGKAVHGAMAYASLAAAPGPIDMVEIFRSSEYAGGIVDEALKLDPLPRVIWMQLGVEDAAAAERARARGIEVVMNRCPKIEWGRLSGEIGWHGVNSRIISARKPVVGKGFQRLSIGPGPAPAHGAADKV